MRPTWRSLTAGVLASVVLLALLWRPAPFQPPWVLPAEAQGVGIFARTDCTTLTSVVTGQTVCFDQTANVLKVWNGSRWISGENNYTQIRNVLDYGAVGDGITNDTAALRLAISAATATSANAGWVFLPPSLTFSTNSTVIPLSTGGGTTQFYASFLGSGLLVSAPVSGQTNYVNNLFQPMPTGPNQQIAVGAFINGIASGSTTGGRIGFFSSARTGGGTGAGTGNPVWAINTVAQQNPGDTTATIIGIENDLNSDKADATLDMNPPQVGFSAVSAGSKKAGIAFNVGGVPQWIEGYRVDQGAIATGNWAFRYKGDGVNGGVGIRADGTIENGFFASAIGSPNEIHMLNNKNIQFLNQAGVALIQALSVNTSNQLSIDSGNVGTVHGGAVSFGAGTGGVLGVGTINVASATYMNGKAVLVASANNPNLQNIAGISGTGLSARNLRGSCTFSAAATCAVPFTVNEPDASYFVQVTQTSGTTVDAFRVSNKAVSGFTINASQSNSNSVDWMLLR